MYLSSADAAVGPFSDDFEPDLSSWTTTHGQGSLDWALTTTAPHSPVHAAFADNPDTVSDQYLTLADEVTLGGLPVLSFWHAWSLEPGFDGGVVEISTDNGATWADVGPSAFTQNGYNGTIDTCCLNPLNGRPAFTGFSRRTCSRWPAWRRTPGATC